MFENLHLKYVCTEAELREAQSLNLHQQLGRGSRWRSLLVLFGILAGLLTLVYFRIRTEIAPKYQPWFLLLAAVLFILFHFGQKLSRKKSEQTLNRLEISERDVILCHGNSRVITLWSGFSQCLESPNLFVLLDRPKGVLFVIPKRAFPDTLAQHWFRTLANRTTTTGAPLSEPLTPPPLPDGIVVCFELGYRDYLNRTLTSWRTKAVLILVFGLIVGTCLWQAAHPSPRAVNGPLVVLAIALLLFGMTISVALTVVSFIAWRTDKQYLEPQRLTLSSRGLDFVSRDSSGLLPWETYKYYLENHRCFLIWNPRGQAWLMIPKRAFESSLAESRCRDLLKMYLQNSRWFFI